MNRFIVPVIVSVVVSAAGCSKKPAEEATTSTTTVATTEPAAPAATVPAPTPAPAADAPAPVGTYDTGKAPVSTVALGAFPYLSLPAGYTPGSAETLDLARFPIWVGDHFVWIEGKVYQSTISAGEGKTYSKYEVQRNIEDVVTQAGGKKISETQLPSSMREKLNPEARQVDTGLGDIIQNPAVTFLIHRADKDIWVHFVSGTSSGNWAIVETKAFVPTAKLLPAAG